MVFFRRYLVRLFRLRNLVTFTIILIILYMIKNISNITVDSDIPAQEAQVKPVDAPEKPPYFVPTSAKKKDWHNYTQIREDQNREGIGEHGQPAELPEKDSALEERLYAENGFNGALSDRIPLNRSLPDIRHPGCKKKLYIESLPTVSVVVPFHNEHWSTLLRTAYGVLNRSPPHLLREIFLVDDASTKTLKYFAAYGVLNRSPPHLLREIFLVDDASTKSE
ncbi:polypeptide N-acetylgalactosaminyltransferase 10-like [Ostrinia furnacalis]|uniref:polypeptide N-acetylgalactosaminyltransferase 10-like n=1 Tax=Ostrinia furnacalis TaxID=93504 RepID=UPI00103EA8C6|nr:polypeptide N-acetylgalactosaminyltransferase 10-like [Ostrinia furnacalis]